VQLVALVIPVHDSVVACPACTVVGAAVNVPIVGRVDCTVTLHVAVLPRVTVTVYVPAAAYAVLKVELSVPVDGVPPGADHAKLLNPLTAEKLAFAPTATVCVAGVQLTCDGAVTVKIAGALVPAAVVTVTLRAPSAAAVSTAKVALSDVLLATATLATATPEPLTATVVAPATKLVPVRTCAGLVPVAPSACRRLVIVGNAIPADEAATIVNGTGELFPPDVCTVTFRAPAAADGSMTKLAVIDDALWTVSAVTDTPLPLTETVVPPLTNPAPLNERETVVPALPLANVQLRVDAPGFATYVFSGF